MIFAEGVCEEDALDLLLASLSGPAFSLSPKPHRGWYGLLGSYLSSQYLPPSHPLEDMDLPGSPRGVPLPATPIPITDEVVLSGASLEDLIAGF